MSEVDAITPEDVSGFSQDIRTTSEVVESPELTTVTKNGITIDTLAGRLLKLGYLAPVAYAGAISFLITDQLKTIERSGTIYAPNPGDLPFTTSGTWVADDEDKFYVVQGINESQGFIQPFANYDAFINSAVIPTLPTGTPVEFLDPPGSTFYLDTGAVPADEDDGNYIISDVDVTYFIRRWDWWVINVRNFGAVGEDLAADDAAFIAAKAAALKIRGTPAIYVPGLDGTKNYRLNRGHDWTDLRVYGDGQYYSKIQFEPGAGTCITAAQQFVMHDLWLHGGWDGLTAQVPGADILTLFNPSAFGLEFRIRDCVIRFSEDSLIRMQRAGQATFRGLECETSAGYGLDIDGIADVLGESYVITSASFYGCKFSSTASDNVRLSEAQNVTFDGCILENGLGVSHAGTVSRAICFKSTYFEFGGPNIITWVSGGLIGFSVIGCFGGLKVIPYDPNVFNVLITGNGAITENGLAWNDILRIQGSQTFSAVDGGFDATVTSIALNPGVYHIFAKVQTQNVDGVTDIRTGCLLTTNAADSGLVLATDNSGYVHEAGLDHGRDGNSVAQCDWEYKNDTGSAQTVYLRTNINHADTGFSIAYNGTIRAIPVQGK